MIRIGIDVGGTHTDGVILKDSSILKKGKVVTNHENLEDSITELITLLTEGLSHTSIDKITLSTTLTTNLILENKLPHTGLILSGGPGINLDNFKKDNFSYIVSGAIDHRGRVLKHLNLNEIENIIDTLIDNDIETVAVCSKFSIRNPVHEIQIKDRLTTKFSNVTMGHSLSGKLNFPRRINTAYLNAATFKKNKDFIANITTFLNKHNFNCPIYILKADGGTITTEEALHKPIQTILSGSAAGVIGVMSLINIEEEAAAVIDIGGTSSDFTIFYKNEPLFEPDGIKIGNELTLVRAIYSHSLGLGGDSFIQIKNNEIEIGPERKGHAIAFGGSYLTPTDVVIFYEKIKNPNIEKIKSEIEKISKVLYLNIEETVIKILKTFACKINQFLDNMINEINNKPLYTIKEIIGYKDIKIDKIYLMGAPAKNFQYFLKEFLNYSIDVIPYSDTVNAIGSAVSKTTDEINLFADTSVGKLSIPEIEYYDEISSNFSLDDCHKLIRDKFKNKEFEITEEMVFNIISGFFRAGKTYRIKAQIKPGVEIFLTPKNLS